MESLFDELFDLICSNLEFITDLRCISRVCKKYNLKCQKQIVSMETHYKQKYKDLNLAGYFNNYCIEKFTNEIVFDGYYNLLSEKYYNENNKVICSVLALCGNIELMKYAFSKSCPTTNYVVCCAAYGGHENILDWIIKNTEIKINPVDICKNAAGNGKLNILEFIRYDFGMDYKTCNIYAANYAQIHILEWLSQIGLIDVNMVCVKASLEGHLNVLLWIIQKGMHIDYEVVVANATHNDHLHIIEWVNKKTNIINSNNIMGIIGSVGAIKILQWLYDNNYEINNYVICKNAIKFDVVSCLQWLYDNNYSINDNAIKKAAKYNHNQVFQWLHDHNHKLYEAFYDDIFKFDSSYILEWIIKNNYEINDSIYINSIDVCKKNIVDLILVDKFNIKYIKLRRQYHFTINHDNISVLSYGVENNCDKQKIIQTNKNGNINTCDFNCGNNCWLYFLMYCRNWYKGCIEFSLNKINGCSQHKEYIQFIINKEI